VLIISKSSIGFNKVAQEANCQTEAKLEKQVRELLGKIPKVIFLLYKH
jgi:hypothetical protein